MKAQATPVVGFLDTGTLTDDVGFDDYRVAVGAGMALFHAITWAPFK